jgi:hypothetical protein
MSRSTDPKHTITGTYLRDTDKAIQFKIVQIGPRRLKVSKVEWFPISQTSKTFRAPPSCVDEDYLVVSQWILQQKSLLDNEELYGERESDIDPDYPDGEYDELSGNPPF